MNTTSHGITYKVAMDKIAIRFIFVSVATVICLSIIGCTSVAIERENQKEEICESAGDWAEVKSWNEKTTKSIRIWPQTVPWLIDWFVAPFDSNVMKSWGPGMDTTLPTAGRWFVWGFGGPIGLSVSPLCAVIDTGWNKGPDTLDRQSFYRSITCVSFSKESNEEKKEVVRSGSGRYPGADANNCNYLCVTINSEPQGARIYEDGKFAGTTPFQCNYTLKADNYRTGVLRPCTLTAVKDGYLPAKITPELSVEEKWKYNHKSTFESAKGVVVFLRPDPNHPRPITIVQQPRRSDTSDIAISIIPAQEHSDHSAERQEAQASYDTALSAYEEVLKAYDNAKNMERVNRATGSTLMNGNNFQKALGLFNQTVSGLDVQQVERNLEIARERLNQAKSRLDAVNWK